MPPIFRGAEFREFHFVHFMTLFVIAPRREPYFFFGINGQSVMISDDQVELMINLLDICTTRRSSDFPAVAAPIN